MTTGRINQVAALDGPAVTGPSRCVGRRSAPAYSDVCMCGCRVRCCLHRRPHSTTPFLLFPIGFFPGRSCRLCNLCLGRAVVCNAVRRANVGRPDRAPAGGRSGQLRRLHLQLGVCALRRPHKLRVCQDLLFQGRGPCTANLLIGCRLGPALLVSHDSQDLPLIPVSLAPAD